MWWTVDDRGLLAHAVVADADLALALRVVGVALRALTARTEHSLTAASDFGTFRTR